MNLKIENLHQLHDVLAGFINDPRTAVHSRSTPSNWSEAMKHLSITEIAIIKARILRGDKYHEIASDYRINQGRIADLKFGRIYKGVRPARM